MTTPPRKTKLYRKKMWARRPSGSPTNVSDTTHYYETRKGIEVYVWNRLTNPPTVTKSIIPWKFLEASRKRCLARTRVSELPKAAGRGRGK